MTKEFRRITFSRKTLRLAAAKHCERTGGKLPAGDIVSIKALKKGSDYLFETGFFDFSSKKNSVFRISESDAAGALIQYCLGAHIPIPRDATKTARLVDGYLCLDINMGVKAGSNFEADA